MKKKKQRKKPEKLTPKQKRKIDGFTLLGKDVEWISSLLDLPISDITSYLTRKAGIMDDEDDDPFETSKKLMELGERKLDAIMEERARQVRSKGFCTD